MSDTTDKKEDATVAHTALAGAQEFQSSQVAAQDKELGEHVAEFLQSVHETVQMCRMNLLTEEDARKAASTIADLRRKVHRHRRTAHALKRLLQQKEATLPTASPEWERPLLH